MTPAPWGTRGKCRDVPRHTGGGEVPIALLVWSQNWRVARVAGSDVNGRKSGLPGCVISIGVTDTDRRLEAPEASTCCGSSPGTPPSPWTSARGCGRSRSVSPGRRAPRVAQPSSEVAGPAPACGYRRSVLRRPAGRVADLEHLQVVPRVSTAGSAAEEERKSAGSDHEGSDILPWKNASLRRSPIRQLGVAWYSPGTAGPGTFVFAGPIRRVRSWTIALATASPSVMPSSFAVPPGMAR